MPRQFFRHICPRPRDIRKNRYLQFLGNHLHNPSVWHLNRRSVAGAFAVGLFCAFLPVPFQTVIAATLAILVGVNLPLSFLLVFITNPLTMPPIFYFAYKSGAWLMDLPMQAFHFELSFAWLGTSLSQIWQPFLLGCFTLATSFSLLGYIGVRLLWRWLIVRKLEKRRTKAKQERIRLKQRLKQIAIKQSKKKRTTQKPLQKRSQKTQLKSPLKPDLFSASHAGMPLP